MDLGDGSASGVARAFRILAHFERVRRPCGIGELAAACSLPRSTAAFIVSQLVKLGLLSHDRSSRTYMPTLRVAELGRWVEDQVPGEDRERLVPLLRALAARLEETVVLALRNDLYAQYIHVELPERPVLYVVKVGALRPMCRSAVGWALLSLDDDDRSVETVRRFNATGEGQRNPIDAERVLDEVRATRRRGYAFSRHSVVQGVAMIARAFRGPASGQRLAVGVGGPVERLDQKEREIAAALLELTAGLGGALTQLVETPGGTH
ncbi:MAG: helix-turn-helix domain-containing protein [Candidatus Rokubacteria bacterium]|nr:helix-turn-helix domain-containing protein [Candidatus Rokubacteria bacterium]